MQAIIGTFYKTHKEALKHLKENEVIITNKRGFIIVKKSIYDKTN